MGTHRRFSKHPTCSMSATEIKLFNKYSFEDVAVQDIALKDYVACKPQNACFLPHSAGRWAKKRFKKAQCPIIERITNALMMHGRNNDKKILAVRIMKHTCDIIHLTTGARDSAFRNIKTIAECLAEEFQNAAKGSSNSYAIKKKDEIERVAKANR